MYDILIQNARIADGTGNAMYHGDVAIRDGKIAKIGCRLKAQAEKVIDGTGKVLAPGFIDAHSHLDKRIEAVPHCAHMLAQGVTTIIGGMCGGSAAPISEEHYEDGLRITGIKHSEESLRARLSLDGYIQHLETIPLGCNFTFLVGHGNIRVAAMGYVAEKATPADLERMREVTRQCMEAGAMGVSFGLIYPPGSYANTEEMIAVAEVVAEYGGVITAHIRGEGKNLIEATDELLQVARATGVRTVHSHHKASGGPMNWNKTAATLSMMEKAIADGFDIFCDEYPYTASSNGMKSTIPDELHALGMEKLTEMMTDPKEREALRPVILGGKTPHERFKYIMIGNSASHPEYAGRMLNEIADQLGADPYELHCDLLRDDKMGTTAIYLTACEEDVERVMKWDRTMIGSDGGSGETRTGHPRTFGTFTRVLARYVREKKVVSLESAIRKMTYLPSMVYNLSTKGLIREGMDADLVLFDPETIADLGDFVEPAKGNVGLSCVLVNGKIAVENDQVTGVRNGKIFFRK
ncbi:MAG: D-aminoacylase [Clostridia bacterium]|nr:D-aminoacylase [Clostridia bacterium]